MHRAVQEETRFGCRTARAFIAELDDLPSLVAFCREDHTQLLIVRCPASALTVAQALEAEGARLMDALLYFERSIGEEAIPKRGESVSIRVAASIDSAEMAEVAREAFTDFSGHYHSDPLLDRRTCDDIYAEWAENSAGPSGSGAIAFIAEDERGVAGFATARMNCDSESEGVLFAVRPRAQGKGVARELMIEVMRWGAASGALTTVIPTQVTNLASQKVWLRLGFEPCEAVYTFHLWLP